MRRLMVSQASAWIFFGIGRNWGAVKSASRCCYPLEGEVDKHLQEEIHRIFPAYLHHDCCYLRLLSVPITIFPNPRDRQIMPGFLNCSFSMACLTPAHGVFHLFS